MSTRHAVDENGSPFTYEVDDGTPPDDLRLDVTRPRDERDVDVDPESVRGKVLALYDRMDAVRDALETEWYNGNLTEPGYDRLRVKMGYTDES